MIAIAVVAVHPWQALASHDMDPSNVVTHRKVFQRRGSSSNAISRYQCSLTTRGWAAVLRTGRNLPESRRMRRETSTGSDIGHARFLLPALVSPVPEDGRLIWSIFVVNLAAIGSAAVAVGHLARRLGTTAWLGLVVALTPAMIESVEGSLADTPAFCARALGHRRVAAKTLARRCTLHPRHAHARGHARRPVACALGPRHARHHVKMLSPQLRPLVPAWVVARCRCGYRPHPAGLVEFSPSMTHPWCSTGRSPAWAKNRYRQPSSVPRCDVGGGGAFSHADALAIGYRRSAWGCSPRSRLVDRVERAGNNTHT